MEDDDTANAMTSGRRSYGIKHIRLRRFGSDNRLHIGNFCSIADNILVYLGGNHRVDWITTFPFGHIFKRRFGGDLIPGHPASGGDVVIGNDVWIGAGSTLMSGIRVGDGAVIAANSHVVSDVEPYAIVGGNPAKFIKLRFEPAIIELLLELRWWELDEDYIEQIIPTLCAPPSPEALRELIKTYRG